MQNSKARRACAPQLIAAPDAALRATDELPASIYCLRDEIGAPFRMLKMEQA